ncbi:hypothetical protein FZC74_17290 [Sutcliffiella horikoshii]|uniref:Uncharacterized protein n=1 Tax=Sutcliffiella horikoshii TaxID=79883 RepID=A0AA94WL99_9BACI|nr:hypothetical protein FZC74_17290 [Sutcliffiella horikoshii]
MRPLKRREEARAPSRGKRSHLRKGTACITKQPKVERCFSYFFPYSFWSNTDIYYFLFLFAENNRYN